MLKSFLALGLSMDATDQDIRKKYLQLVKKYSPEKNPERFRRITTAYEAIKDKRSRLYTELFGAFNDMAPEATIDALAADVEIARARPGLEQLLSALKKDTPFPFAALSSPDAPPQPKKPRGQKK